MSYPYQQGIQQFVPTYKVRSDYLPQNMVQEGVVDSRANEVVNILIYIVERI